MGVDFFADAVFVDLEGPDLGLAFFGALLATFLGASFSSDFSFPRNFIFSRQVFFFCDFFSLRNFS